MSMQQASNASTDPAQCAMTLPIRDRCRSISASRIERRCLGLFARILLSFVHFLLELLGFFLVDEGETGEAVFELKGVEEGAVLVVREGCVDLLVPDDTSVGRLPQDMSQFRHVASIPLRPTDTSTILIQKVLPTKSLASTAAPCRPV